MRIVDKLKQAEESGLPYFSFEYFPPKTEQGLVNLYDRIERMGRTGPAFVAVTWGAGGATAQRTLELSEACQGIFGLDTLMHITCTNMDRDQVDQALAGARSAGVRNILALRGDAPRGDEFWSACSGGFTHAVDLVRYVREAHGDYFCIGVAGYPEGHSESTDPAQDLEYLAEKVRAGADFVVSQLVYDADIFIDWLQRCRDVGIACPVVPGVLPVQSYQSFRRLVHLTKVAVPEALRQALDDVSANDQAVKDLGVEHAVATVRKLQAAGVRGVHITTLNLENTVMRVLSALDLGTEARRLTPRISATQTEPSNVVPGAWDDFPNGRWGDARSPAFGNLGSYVSTYGTAMQKIDSGGSAWGEPTEIDHISELFVGYVEGSVASLPWSDEPLLAETQRIKDELVRVNRLGFWTLASQPALDGAASDDLTYGWGPRGGYIYQKAFVECFVHTAMFPAFLSRLQSASPRITYYASNRAGDFVTNAYSGPQGDGGAVTALTWGVFPGRAVVQPTLIDKMNFLAWRTEAFHTWEEWAAVFPKDSPQELFLREMADKCWLVNVVDNEYRNADAIWNMFQ
ncbi:methylenetetrahydrofolate reductase 1 [Coemansia sp. RSA 922]|nr:methylenetetrahydrofolate reductase 1 [Coemansia sp. S3946]KAJ2107832.1 methylenetetrahydrofolate reductase 1 [Coemansia sp. RSA 922]